MSYMLAIHNHVYNVRTVDMYQREESELSYRKSASRSPIHHAHPEELLAAHDGLVGVVGLQGAGMAAKFIAVKPAAGAGRAGRAQAISRLDIRVQQRFGGGGVCRRVAGPTVGDSVCRGDGLLRERRRQRGVSHAGRSRRLSLPAGFLWPATVSWPYRWNGRFVAGHPSSGRPVRQYRAVFMAVVLLCSSRCRGQAIEDG